MDSGASGTRPRLCAPPLGGAAAAAVGGGPPSATAAIGVWAMWA